MDFSHFLDVFPSRTKGVTDRHGSSTAFSDVKMWKILLFVPVFVPVLCPAIGYPGKEEKVEGLKNNNIKSIV